MNPEVICQVLDYDGWRKKSGTCVNWSIVGTCWTV